MYVVPYHCLLSCDKCSIVYNILRLDNFVFFFIPESFDKLFLPLRRGRGSIDCAPRAALWSDYYVREAESRGKSTRRIGTQGTQDLDVSG